MRSKPLTAPKNIKSLAVVLLTAGFLAACAPQPGVGQSTLVSPTPQRTVVLRQAPDPKSLIGVTPQAVEQQLGAPAFDGSDGEARIWRYSGSNCALLVVFYPEADGSIKSTHLDARRLQGGSTPIEPCLREVVNAPRA
ncbi:MAG: hypothetical protein R8J41_09410 [Alphaproteobacteria bacterium]|nr:hypothetical protein [Alphaproteobacteria bacterium]